MVVAVRFDLFLGRQYRLGFAHFQDNVAFGYTLYCGGNQVAFTIHKLAIDVLALNFFYAL